MEIFSSISGLLPIAGWLGLGGIIPIILIVVGIYMPNLLFPAICLAGGIAAMTFSYGKGLHDDYVVQQAKTVQALKDELSKETAARQEAEDYVKKNPVHQAGTKKPFSKLAHPLGGLSDNWNRDSTVNSGPVKNSVQPVESNKLLTK